MTPSPCLIRVQQMIGFGILLTATASVFADAPKEETYPPVEQASFHQVVFADQDLVVLNNRYPPSGDSGFHAHDRDQFYVVIHQAETSGQTPGQPLKTGQTISAGTTGYGGTHGERRVHRVINGDKGPAQFIVIEFLHAKPKGIEVSSRDKANQYAQIVDNPRLRAWRLVLDPGQSASAITQQGKGVRVVVRGGLLTTTSPGAPDQTNLLQPADVAIQPAGTTRTIKNSGTDPIEFVELELK